MVTVTFTCKTCKLKKQSLQVPARDAESLPDWFEKVQHWIAEEHTRISPGCISKRVDVWLPPADGVETIGQQIE